MTEHSPNLEQKIQAVVETLETQARRATTAIGYMKGTIDNPAVGRKLEDSASGRILKALNNETIKSAAMFVCRCFDSRRRGDKVGLKTHSIPEFIDLCDKHSDPRLSESLCQIEEIRSGLISSNQYQNLRLYRDEIVSHALYGRSDYRNKNFPENYKNPIDNSDTLDLSLKTISIIKMITLACDRRPLDYGAFIAEHEASTRAFWDVLPKLSEVEGEALHRYRRKNDGTLSFLDDE